MRNEDGKECRLVKVKGGYVCDGCNGRPIVFRKPEMGYYVICTTCNRVKFIKDRKKKSKVSHLP